MDGQKLTVPDPPLDMLLRVTLNALLYATSAGPGAEERQSPRAPGKLPPRDQAVVSSDSVFFLPGTIDISRLRKLQDLGRAPSGGQMLHRFMVRGHWRRPAKNWHEQRARWIAPYWKGPDLASVIERTYKFKP